MRKNQKGFTLVELLVVIAILAILATVAVVGYSSFIDSANKSVDQQVVAQMNTALQAASVEGRPQSRTDLLKLFYKHDIDINKLSPVTEGYAFYWNQDDNKIVIVKNGEEVGKGWSLLTSNGYGKELKVDNNTSTEAILTAIANSTEAEPALIKLTENVVWNETRVMVDKDKCVVVDLNGYTFTSKDNGQEVAWQANKNGMLTIKNGNILGGVSNCEGYVTLNGVNISRITENYANTVGTIYIQGESDTYISNCEISRNGTGKVGHTIGTNAGDKKNSGARIYITDSTITKTGDGDAAGINITIDCDITINHCTITGVGHGAYFHGCSANIINSTFNHTSKENGKEWGQGNEGPYADIVFACGEKGSGYATTANYTCENVTAETVYVHQPEGGKVTVSGIKYKEK